MIHIVDFHNDWFCPEHSKKLQNEKDILICPEGDTFPIINGIPRFVSGPNYADAFGLQWNQYRITQLDSFTKSNNTQIRLRRCLGSNLFDNLMKVNVLECGCGAGRFTEILLNQGAKLTSIDLSNAVEANNINFPISENHNIAQADIAKLPLLPQSFDVVLCLGVIQHTPSPESTIAELYKYVRPGGWLVIDHYAFTISWYLRTAPLFRFVLKRMPPGKAMNLIQHLVNIFLPFHKFARNNYLLHGLINRISPVYTYYRALPELSDELQKEWALLDTHDALTDWYKHFRTKGSIYKTLNSLGLQDITCEYGGNGIEARGKRPI